jgi:hypothetical protein
MFRRSKSPRKNQEIKHSCKGSLVQFVSLFGFVSEVEMARPARFEHATFCLEAMQYKTLSAASGVAYEEARHLSRP